MKSARTFIISALALGSFLLSPAAALAQNAQRFNPNATLNMSGGTFNGISFSGVGGAIAACTDTGASIERWTNKAVNGIANLFNDKKLGSNEGSDSSIRQDIAEQAGISAGSAAGQHVPVADEETKEELERANRREQCLNGVAYAVAKSMLQQITDKTLAYVNTGNLGNPFYVRDLPSYLGNLTDRETARFLDRIPSQNPIFGNAIRSIITEQVSGISDGLINQAMDTPEGRAYQEFQEDFAAGGWEAYLDPNNSALDAIFNAGDSLAQNISQQHQEVRDQLQRNEGFLDVKRCVEYADHDASTQEDIIDSLNELDRCLTWETVTPGSVIASQIKEITASPIRQLEQADQINEVFGAYFDQLLNWLYSQGLASLRGRGGSDPYFGSGGANIVAGSFGQPINSSFSQNVFGYSPTAQGGYTSTDFDVSRPQHIRAVLEVQLNYINRAEDSWAAAARVVPVLGALDYCIPGPNPTWADGLDENVRTYAGSLQVETTNGDGSSTGAAVGSGVGAVVGSIVPGIGTAIGSAVGNLLGSLVGGLIDNGKPHGLIAFDVSLYDKVVDAPVLIRNTHWHQRNRSPEAVGNNLQTRLNEVFTTYEETFTKENVTNAFLAVDSANTAYVQGFAETAFIETAKLPVYDRALAGIENDYATAIADTRDAILELEDIREEVNEIVAVAKARYIAQQAAAGTPVNQACIDSAYDIDTSPIVVPPRVESDAPSPYLNQSVEGSVYFYSHL